MKLHVLSIPHTITSEDYLSCAFTQKVLKFCKMMTPYYSIIHYGHENSDVICHEHVSVIDDHILKETYGEYDWKSEFFKHNVDDLAHRTFNENAKYELVNRVEEGDAVLCFWGKGVANATSAVTDKSFIIEPGIGYKAEGVFAPFKIFESYSHMHRIYGSLGIKYGQLYDAVIPNYFDVSNFEYTNNKQDYFLFLSRMTKDKGLTIAIEATRHLGCQLVVAGQGSFEHLGYDSIPQHVDFVGFADLSTRKELMKNAKALLLPSLYLEPFGGVIVEAMLSGTPVITSDWGAFSENNLHGITGFRCRSDEHFLWALKNIEKINPETCRQWAEKNFSLEKVATMYDEYLQNLKTNFFHNNQIVDSMSLALYRKELNWLERTYPNAKGNII